MPPPFRQHSCALRSPFERVQSRLKEALEWEGAARGSLGTFAGQNQVERCVRDSDANEPSRPPPPESAGWAVSADHAGSVQLQV